MFQAVLNFGYKYIELLQNESFTKLGQFKNQWKYEFDRVLTFQRIMEPKCKSLTVYGDEANNYDEAKRFCFLHKNIHQNHTKTYGKYNCSVYSIGSNNKWSVC